MEFQGLRDLPRTPTWPKPPDTALPMSRGGTAPLTLTATGSAVLVQDQAGEITGLTVTPEKD